MSNQVRATATVQVTLELRNVGGVWGAGCTIEQVQKQARDAALMALHDLVEKRARVVGEPTVIAVLVMNDT